MTCPLCGKLVLGEQRHLVQHLMNVHGLRAATIMVLLGIRSSNKSLD